MLLHQFHIQNGRAQIGIWQLREPLSYFEERCKLPAAEQAMYDEISHPERKRQWLAARYLLRTSLQLTQNAAVLRNAKGRPYLSDGSWHVSISHTKDYVACMGSRTHRVGIDIENLELGRNPEAKRMFMNAEEQAQLGSEGPHDPFFRLLWCTKESLYKLYNDNREGISFRRHLYTTSDPADDSIGTGIVQGGIEHEGLSEKVPVHYLISPPLVAAYATAADASKPSDLVPDSASEKVVAG